MFPFSDGTFIIVFLVALGLGWLYWSLEHFRSWVWLFSQVIVHWNKILFILAVLLDYLSASHAFCDFRSVLLIIEFEMIFSVKLMETIVFPWDVSVSCYKDFWLGHYGIRELINVCLSFQNSDLRFSRLQSVPAWNKTLWPLMRRWHYVFSIIIMDVKLVGH